jgi:hypothetical protein
MHTYNVVVNGVVVASFDNKYDANRMAMAYAVTLCGSVTVEYYHVNA